MSQPLYKKENRVSTSSFEEYRKSCLEVISARLAEFYGSLSGLTIERIKADQDSINAYANIGSLKEIAADKIYILDESEISTEEAEKVLLKGDFFWEHAAAGEATRLGLGTKYIIRLSDFSAGRISSLILDEIKSELKAKKDPDAEKEMEAARRRYSEEGLIKMMGCKPESLLPLSLGARHMLQMVYDVRRIAEKNSMDPDEAVRRQKTLVILNETTGDRIVEEFVSKQFYGLNPMNVLFMIQKSFNGISIINGELAFTSGNNKRLHNHGQMMMQKAHQDSVFRFSGAKKEYLRIGGFEDILKGCRDYLSYNIEDTDYLACSVDLASLGLSLKLGEKGYRMVMEIVSQNPLKPQKGGAAFYDPVLQKNVMIESNRLKGLRPEEIKHLNRNFNHYPNPYDSFSKMKQHGLELPFEVKKGADGFEYIYPCPVQGDMNFLVNTAFVMRKVLKPINNWKSAMTMPNAVRALHRQEQLPGFRSLAEKYI